MRKGGRFLAAVHPLDKLRHRGFNNHDPHDALMLLHQLFRGIAGLFDRIEFCRDRGRVDGATSNSGYDFIHGYVYLPGRNPQARVPGQ